METIWFLRAHHTSNPGWNTAYFHHKAHSRRRRNFIKGLEDDDGMRHEEQHRVTEIIKSFFQELFSSSAADQVEATLNGIEEIVTASMNEALCVL